MRNSSLPRLNACVRYAANLSVGEAASCIAAFRAGRAYDGEAVNHFGGTQAVMSAAMRYRHMVKYRRYDYWSWWVDIDSETDGGSTPGFRGADVVGIVVAELLSKATECQANPLLPPQAWLAYIEAAMLVNDTWYPTITNESHSVTVHGYTFAIRPNVYSLFEVVPA